MSQQHCVGQGPPGHPTAHGHRPTPSVPSPTRVAGPPSPTAPCPVASPEGSCQRRRALAPHQNRPARRGGQIGQCEGAADGGGTQPLAQGTAGPAAQISACPCRPPSPACPSGGGRAAGSPTAARRDLTSANPTPPPVNGPASRAAIPPPSAHRPVSLRHPPASRRVLTRAGRRSAAGRPARDAGGQGPAGGAAGRRGPALAPGLPGPARGSAGGFGPPRLAET